MDIKYLGHSSFRIRGKNAAIVTDPFDPKMVGIPFPKATADIVTISHGHADHDNSKIVENREENKQFVIIRGPGEYEVKGVKIYGYQTYHDSKEGTERGRNTIYVIHIDGVSILHCGDLGHPLSDTLLEEIDEVHVLLIPTGGIYTLNEKESLQVIRQIDPYFVIPMHYKQAGMGKGFEGLSDVNAFLKEVGKTVEPQAKLTITHDKLPDEMEVVVLTK